MVWAIQSYTTTFYSKQVNFSPKRYVACPPQVGLPRETSNYANISSILARQSSEFITWHGMIGVYCLLRTVKSRLVFGTNTEQCTAAAVNVPMKSVSELSPASPVTATSCNSVDTAGWWTRVDWSQSSSSMQRRVATSTRSPSSSVATSPSSSQSFRFCSFVIKNDRGMFPLRSELFWHLHGFDSLTVKVPRNAVYKTRDVVCQAVWNRAQIGSFSDRVSCRKRPNPRWQVSASDR